MSIKPPLRGWLDTWHILRFLTVCANLTEYLRNFSNCAVVVVNLEESRRMFHPNTVNSLHSYIKETYTHYRRIATKYINCYNALFEAVKNLVSMKFRLS